MDVQEVGHLALCLQHSLLKLQATSSRGDKKQPVRRFSVGGANIRGDQQVCLL